MTEGLDLETGDRAGGQEKKTGDAGGEQKKPRGRPSNDAKASDLGKTIDEGFSELSEWLEGRDPALAAALREGAPRMGRVLAARASKHEHVARLLGKVFAKDGPLAMLRAFGPTARLLGDRVGAWRESRVKQYVDGEGFLVDEHGLRILDETGQPIRGDA